MDEGADAAVLAGLLSALRAGEVHSKEELSRLKATLCKRHRSRRLPPDRQLLAALDAPERERLLPLLRVKGVRSLSGVAVVALMTSPTACPHGRCVYCPGGPTTNTPQSYTGLEPAARRGAQHGYDPFTQATSRLAQLEGNGHDTDKVDLIIMGGTFTARPTAYQESFLKGAFDALNGTISTDLQSAMLLNEGAARRCTGLTVETKPDWCKQPHLERMLESGVTRVELGVQSTDESTLERMHRGHTLQDTVEATALARDAGLKVGYHLMPGLPGATRDDDRNHVRTIVDDPRFRPDILKFYPTLVIAGTGLYELWQQGRYEALGTDQMVQRLADAKELVAPYMRIHRIQRDIPLEKIAAGVDKANIRQLAVEELSARGKACACIRCREAGLRERLGRPAGPVSLVERTYEASEGTEVFLSLEDQESTTVAYLRLRIPTHSWRPELTGGIVREVRVVGRVSPIGEAARGRIQHRGLGRQLLGRAERIAAETYDAPTLAVIAAVGSRRYYHRLGYTRVGPYVRKDL